MASFEEASVGFKSVFQKTYNDTVNDADKLATVIRSNDLSEKYLWLGNFPNMREWIGDRTLRILKDFGYSIENKSYESTVTVPLKHIDYDKVGLYKPAIEQMAQNAKLFSAELLGELVINGHLNNCYDGKKFFAADHVVGEGAGAVTYSNMGAGVLNSANLIETKKEMLEVKNEANKTLRVNPNLIVAGPQNLSNLVIAIDNQLGANGESNATYKMFEYIIMPEITGTEWYMLDVSKPIKPFISQIAEDVSFEASDDNKFMKDDALFGVKAFMNAGYGLWQLAFKRSGVAA